MSVLLMSDIIIVTRESVIAEERGIYVEHTKADIIFKDFWRNNERFADLFNVVVFGGKRSLSQRHCMKWIQMFLVSFN